MQCHYHFNWSILGIEQLKRTKSSYIFRIWSGDYLQWANHPAHLTPSSCTVSHLTSPLQLWVHLAPIPHPYSCGCILLLNCPNLPLTSLHLHCILQHTVLEQNNIATHIHPQHTTFFFYRYFRSPFLKRSLYFITKYLHLQKYKHPNAPTNSLAFSSTT